MSADEGAVEALLCLLEDVSVDVALVVLDPPLPLSASASSHHTMSVSHTAGLPIETTSCPGTARCSTGTGFSAYLPVSLSIQHRKHVVAP